MVNYLLRKAKKKAECPLSPQHDWVTSVDTDIIRAVSASVGSGKLSGGYMMSLDFFILFMYDYAIWERDPKGNSG